MSPMGSWKTPWMSFVSCVTVLKIFSLTVCAHTLGTSSNSSNSNPELPLELHCPDPALISPCECTFNPAIGMDMNCSQVTSDDDLRRVFSNNFTFTNFRELKIRDNTKLKIIREGAFGSASFTYISIKYTFLMVIETEALKGSFHTLVTLEIHDNSLISVPDISAFTRLEKIYASSNQISLFPNGSSATLYEIDLSGNHIDDVPKDAIVGFPSLVYLYMFENSLTEIHPDTFTRNENLTHLDLADNRLTTIPDDAIKFYGPTANLYIYKNQITSLPYGAVSSVTDLKASVNKLTELPEEVFRPLLEDYANIKIYDNPFKCGCDMAWLVLNQTLLKRLQDADYTKCPDGEAFTSLDPEIYKVMCPDATAEPQ